MTEADWTAGIDDPATLLDHLPAAVGTRRKYRLLAVAACRRVWGHLKLPAAEEAVVLAERHADGLAARADLTRAGDAVDEYVRTNCGSWPRALGSDPHILACNAAGRAAWSDPTGGSGNVEGTGHALFEVPQVAYFAAQRAAGGAAAKAAILAETEHLFGLIRCVFGNPVRPVAFDPAWRTPTAVALADAVYAGRAFDRLPVLADALEEAGCDTPDVLAHCRGDGPHARGCWVVDLVLGKS